MFGGFFFGFMTPSTLGGLRFFNSNPFFMIFNVPNVSIGVVEVLLNIGTNGALPSDPTYLEHLTDHSSIVLP